MRPQDIDVDNLILDPNNYRLQDEAGFRATAKERFAIEQVQRATLLRLKSEGLRELRDSIVANGFLPIERIVVTPYLDGDVDGKFLVIEGNRRTAALKQIKAEIDGGIDIPQRVSAILDRVPCIVVEHEGQDAFFKETLMGIRHVGGIRQWGGYQRAKLISDMRDVHGLEPQEVAAKLGLPIQEVNRRYRAFRALQQMRESEDYADFAEPALYPIFHEAIAVPAVRQWLDWNSEACRFEAHEPLEMFYRLITPTTGGEGQQDVPPKLKSYAEVRELKSILPNVDAKRILLDPDRSFIEALTIANNEELSRKWRDELTEAIASLRNIGALEVQGFNAEDVELVDRLIDASTGIRKIYDRLRQQ